MRKILRLEFFKQNSDQVARKLIGKYLVRKIGNVCASHMVVEAEAYGGSEDLASHARFGRTKRNKLMWGEAGIFYVYFIYGMHWMLNIVCGKTGDPGAVLIRGVEGHSGPGRVTKDLNVDGDMNSLKVGTKAGLWFEDRGIVVGNRDVAVKKRVGVDYAKKWKDKLWNFSLTEKLYQSR